MWYYVYSQYTQDGKLITLELGRTRYEEDAKILLNSAVNGYISHRGEVVHSKNMMVPS